MAGPCPAAPPGRGRTSGTSPPSAASRPRGHIIIIIIIIVDIIIQVPLLLSSWLSYIILYGICIMLDHSMVQYIISYYIMS